MKIPCTQPCAFFLGISVEPVQRPLPWQNMQTLWNCNKATDWILHLCGVHICTEPRGVPDLYRRPSSNPVNWGKVEWNSYSSLPLPYGNGPVCPSHPHWGKGTLHNAHLKERGLGGAVVGRGPCPAFHRVGPPVPREPSSLLCDSWKRHC